IDKGCATLDDIENGKDFFTAIAFLNAQSKSSKIEQFIRKKLEHNTVKTKDRGDGEKDRKFYEYKISTTNKDKQINALQIRLWQEVDYYLLGYIDEQQFENSRLYLLPHDEMKKQCKLFNSATHGTEKANESNKTVEMSLRVKMKNDDALLLDFEKKFRAKDLEETIFNQ
ncbi:MAG: hypothetical protein LBT56_05370, partial [Prevotellaceae bacterium]|nr:hypothetical protein [Prevotellaceae bacterium]